MIFVFIPALILEIFTTYFALKAVTKNIRIEAWAYFEFTFWNLNLVIPSFAAIYIASAAASQGKILLNYIGKYSSYCSDDSVLLRVRFSFNRLIENFNQFLILFLQINALSNKMRNRPIILTCGFFNIDWTIVLSIFATITTYMVIICQLEKDY